MSELQFPKDPIVGQEYDFAPYKYYWDGTKWKTKGIGYNPVNDLRDELEPRISDNESKVFEALKRSYADAGLNLVEGSFEEGGELLVASDVMITASGDGYSWAGAFPKVVAAGATPATSGGIGAGAWVDRADETLRGELESGDSSLIGYLPFGLNAAHRTLRSKIGESVSVTDFGAKGDGVSDDTVALNAALSAASGGTLYFPAGVYIITGQLVVGTNTKLEGAGRNRSIIRLAPTFSKTLDAVRNNVQTGTVDAYYDKTISFTGIGFDGNNIVNRNASFLSLSKVSDVEVRECGFSAHTHICIAIGASKDVRVTGNYFEGNGRPKPSSVSTPCVWTDITAQGTPFDIIVEDNYFINNNWSCAYFMPTRGSFSRNRCFGNGESGVFSNEHGSNIKYIGNHIDGQKRSNISASGIETGANSIIIADNHISNCASDGVSLTDVHNATVHDNIIFNNGQEPAYFTGAAGIAVITTSSAPNQPDHINIHNNRIGDRQGIKTQVSGIVVGGSGAAVERVMITHNDLTEQKTNSILIAAGKWGSNSFVSDNIGIDGTMDKPFKVLRFQTNSATGVQQITGVGFRPRAVEIYAVLPSTSQSYSCIGVYDGARSEVTLTSVDNAGNVGTVARTPVLIQIKDGSVNTVAEANMVSLDQDGFTINNTVVAGRPWCIAKCYM